MNESHDNGDRMALANDTGDTHPHIVKSFDEQIAKLKSAMMDMGGLVESQVENAVAALRAEDAEAAREVVAMDHTVNTHDVRLDEEIVNFIALRQPMGGDLRTVVAIAKTVTDLERIGDEAEKIARMTIEMYGGEQNPPKKRLLRKIKPMAKQASELLRDSLDSFARLDLEKAVLSVQRDEELDQEFAAGLRELMTYIMEDSRLIGQAMNVIWVIKALERIGDHAKNICEYTIFLIEGKDVRHVNPEVLANDFLDD